MSVKRFGSRYGPNRGSIGPDVSPDCSQRKAGDHCATKVAAILSPLARN